VIEGCDVAFQYSQVRIEKIRNSQKRSSVSANISCMGINSGSPLQSAENPYTDFLQTQLYVTVGTGYGRGTLLTTPTTVNEVAEIWLRGHIIIRK
jgi:hypothetical protein